MKMKIISAASDAGVHVSGAKEGAIELAKYLINKKIDVDIMKINDFNKSTNKLDLRKNEKEIIKYNNDLYNKIMSTKDFTITIGGDHSISIASSLASRRKNGNIGIIWFDAHPDFNTFSTTITGNIHGLPLATITGFGNKELSTFTNEYINYENTVIIGARAIDKLEQENLEKAHIKVFTTDDIKKYGIKYIFEESFKIASNNTNGVHVSYDLDVIDPLIAKGVSVPEINGISYEECIEGLNFILNQDNLVSFDLVEYNSINDIDKKTYEIASTILDQVIKKIASK